MCLFQEMRTNEFDSSSEDEDVGDEDLTPLHISWYGKGFFLIRSDPPSIIPSCVVL